MWGAAVLASEQTCLTLSCKHTCQHKHRPCPTARRATCARRSTISASPIAPARCTSSTPRARTRPSSPSASSYDAALGAPACCPLISSRVRCCACLVAKSRISGAFCSEPCTALCALLLHGPVCATCLPRLGLVVACLLCFAAPLACSLRACCGCLLASPSAKRRASALCARKCAWCVRAPMV